MSNALVERRYRNTPKTVYWLLIISAGITGAVWSAAYVYVSTLVPKDILYVFLMEIVMIAAMSVGVTVVIREYFIVYLFASIWPVAWWNVVHIGSSLTTSLSVCSCY